uniref:ATP synthase F0 subunit 8 n=1 Tax=Hippodamia variegata TaxID=703264 RepID=A0A6C0UAQ2_9CUCU|nr:ATP synthase F0 subunit 8 [Hippodamia variegata]QIB71485.1 ATP synthase F0 subunit 8 [Hippodamia variegata]
MPQAMPLNWMIIYLFIFSMFILINIKMYFNFESNPIKKFNLFNKKNNWKW